MSIRVLAFALLAGASLAQAAPPKSAKPKTDPATTQQSADSIDVDALARSKDASGTTPAPADAPPDAAQPISDATQSGTPPPEAPPSETLPADSGTPQVAPEAAAPAAAAPTDETAAAAVEAKPDAAAPAATPPLDDSQKRLAAGCESRATSLLDDAQKADYGNVTRDFDAKMRTAMPAPQFKKQWESLAQFGKLIARGQSHLGTGEGYTLVMIPLIFEKTNLVAQIACGSDGRIAGFHVTEAPKPVTEAPKPQF
jgi:hypothetical protein